MLLIFLSLIFVYGKSVTENRKQRKITFCTKDKIQPQYIAVFRGGLHVFNRMRRDVGLLRRNVRSLTLGSLASDDGDGNENGTKAIGFDWQNNNFARASRFFVHFSGVTARLRCETS